MSSTADQLIERYMKHLRVELEDLPRARRRELEQEIDEHIVEARATLAAESEAEIRNILDRLGDPADIAAEARERFGVQPRRSGALEVITLILLLVGGIVLPVIGWLVGVVLLWTSAVWTAREKLIGTLVVPGGLLLPLLLVTVAGTSSELCSSYNGGPETCTGGPSLAWKIFAITLLIAAVAGPFATTVYLARRLRRPSVSVAV